MRLTKNSIKLIKETTDNKLTARVCEYILDRWDDCEDKRNIFTDVLHHGCQTGVVSFLIYYKDTLAFYEEYKDEIAKLLHEALDSEESRSLTAVFGDKWDEDDPLALDTHNQNLLAWFGFEEAMYNIARNYEDII